ncbi:uncharacterized protein LOC120635932 [Pararge aegeria]|uniref:uncharacterized protein LOC120635932 n=1 Tax=Pararge aegeria TaxID=116150 RepID=UPI0019D077F1|nr:uncharacterized protein LOC120635932 [Pararge aegeria]
MNDDGLSDDSSLNVIQNDDDICEVLNSERGNSESMPKTGDKRPRETEDSSKDGFVTVSRRKPKKLVRSESHEREMSINGDNENIYFEVSLFGLQILPKQMAFARLLRDENIKNVTKIKYKSPYKIFIQFSDKNEAQKLINCKKINEMDIRAQFTNQGNLSYGIIKGVDLETNEKELLDSLNCEYDIISAKRLKRMNYEGRWIDSESFRLCFRNPVTPLYINAYGFKFDVVRFELPVTQCSGCWKYGHIKKFCKLNKNVCPKCAEHHDNCEVKEFKCINCKGPHMALDKTCPFFKKEKGIRYIMSQENVSYKTGLEIYLKNLKEKELSCVRAEINTEMDSSYIEKNPVNMRGKTYSSVLKTSATVHNNEMKDEHLNEKVINQNKNKFKKTNVHTNYHRENQNLNINNDEIMESDQDTQENPAEKEKRRRQRRFDLKNLLKRIKEIIVSEGNISDKVMLVVKAIIEECKLFLANVLNEGKLYDIFSKIIFNG